LLSILRTKATTHCTLTLLILNLFKFICMKNILENTYSRKYPGYLGEHNILQDLAALFSSRALRF
jgi:hypothetical protein